MFHPVWFGLVAVYSTTAKPAAPVVEPKDQTGLAFIDGSTGDKPADGVVDPADGLLDRVPLRAGSRVTSAPTGPSSRKSPGAKRPASVAECAVTRAC